jgi:hypothetical protein
MYITPLLNELNTKLQRKGKLLLDVFLGIEALEMKLKLINRHAQE